MPNIKSGQVKILNMKARDIPVEPGLYRWYASEDDFRKLISSPYLDGIKNGTEDYAQELLDYKNNPLNTGKVQLDEIQENGVKYYGVYFGKTRGSLRKRIVRQHVREWQVKCVSFFRKKIKCDVCGVPIARLDSKVGWQYAKAFVGLGAVRSVANRS